MTDKVLRGTLNMLFQSATVEYRCQLGFIQSLTLRPRTGLPDVLDSISSEPGLNGCMINGSNRDVHLKTTGTKLIKDYRIVKSKLSDETRLAQQ